MPKEITHIFFAEKILERLRKEVQKVIKNHPDVYYFGSTSPDLFYYYIPLNKKFKDIENLKLGERIHNSSENLFFFILRITNADDSSRNILFSFLSGYLTHVATDIFFHPYIYHITGNYNDEHPEERKLSQRRHRYYETCLDLYILEKFYKTDIRNFNSGRRTYLNKLKKEIILKEYILSLKETYNISISDKLLIDYIHNCYKSFRILRYIFEQTTLWNLILKFKLIKEKVIDYHVLTYANFNYNLFNFETYEYFHPTTNHHEKLSFEEISEKIIQRGLEFIHGLYFIITNQNMESSLIAQYIPYISLNTGLPPQDVREMKYFNISPLFNSI